MKKENRQLTVLHLQSSYNAMLLIMDKRKID